MNIEVLLIQFLVLAFTSVVWWLARRDLASRPAPPAVPAEDTRELEQLCATLEALVTDLAGRLAAVEQRLQENAGASAVAPPALEVPVYSEETPLGLETSPPWGGGSRQLSYSVAERLPPSRPALPVPGDVAEPESASHAALYALLDEGIADPAEIARRTGLGRGEVDLILSLRARRAL